MAEFSYFILFAAGLLMMIKGGDWFVDSAVWVAEVFRIPPIMIGATIVSICTTLPETFMVATAAFKGEPLLAIGTALGSISVNTGLILAILIFSAKPYIENRKEFLRDSFFLIFLIIVLWAVDFFFGEVSRTVGIVFIFLFMLFIMGNVFSARKQIDFDIHFEIEDEEHILGHTAPNDVLPEGIAYDEAENDFDVSFQTMASKIIFFLLGVALILLGSNLLVQNSINIAEILHVPNFLIALIVTSVGTALPELITVITSIKKGTSDLGIGNILGANILNIVQVIGVTAFLLPLPIAGEKSILLFQLPYLLFMVFSVFCFGLFNKGRMMKWNGVWLLALYFIYLSLNILRKSAPVLGPLLF